MEKLELLAPAQNYSCAISAINCGADAIYIGANAFGARVNAKNSLSDIKKIIDYAHLFNVKVYVTINTILDDEELKLAKKLIEQLYEIKVDAIIIQDFGILNLALKGELPPIVLHISTQGDNRELEKIKYFEKLNIKRVILARELPLSKIEEIRKNTSLELEHFVLGALCVSYSGQCYLSCFMGGRSANRGECAQACRKKYSLVDKDGNIIAKKQYLLSLKDNNLTSHFEKLAKAGIKSFKIEGRLKDENYVKNNVLYCHNLLKKFPRTSIGEVISDFEANIEKTFNRGYTEDYLFSKKDNIYNFSSPKSKGERLGTIISINDKNFVIKTKASISPQDGLVVTSKGDLEGCLVNKKEDTKEGVKIFPNKKVNFKKGDVVYRNLNVEFNKTLQNSKTTRKLPLEAIIEKNKITLFDQNKNKVYVEFQDFEEAKNLENAKKSYIKSLEKTQDTPFLIKKITFKDKELSFIPISKLNEIRRNLLEDLKEKILERYRVKVQKPLDIAHFPKEEGDYRLNVHNEEAKEFYEFSNCKVREYSLEKTKDFKNKELMRTKHCLKRAFLGCEGQLPKRGLFLLDEKGEKFPLEFDCKNCEMVVHSPNSQKN